MILLRISSCTLNSFLEKSPYFKISDAFTEHQCVIQGRRCTSRLRPHLDTQGTQWDGRCKLVELHFNILCRVLDVSITSWLNLSKLNTAAWPGFSVHVSGSRCWWTQRDSIWPTFMTAELMVMVRVADTEQTNLTWPQGRDKCSYAEGKDLALWRPEFSPMCLLLLKSEARQSTGHLRLHVGGFPLLLHNPSSWHTAVACWLASSLKPSLQA